MSDLTAKLEEFRDTVLNQRGAMAENGMTGDQINSVLTEFDSLFDIMALRALQAPAIPAVVLRALAELEAIALTEYPMTTFSQARPKVLAETIRAALTAAPTPAPGNGWLPIESAPKDGTHVLVCVAGLARSVGEAYWWEGAWRCWDGENHRRTYMVEVDRWQPLPAPPEKDSKP